MSIEERIFYTDWEINWSKKVLVYFNEKIEASEESGEIEEMSVIVRDQERQLELISYNRELLERKLNEKIE